MGEGGSGIPSIWSPMVCESMCEVVLLDYIFLSPKGGGDVEGRSPTKRRERRGATPESTMTPKNRKDSLFTQTIGKLSCTEQSPIKSKAKYKQSRVG